ncbi:hypothetical protein EX30DRAFT_342315 [Ascodesmis nigricans]|uniref:Uncharacterized protein n=1 Tax=Ascodesmis nigricans TaxID=341454 RepID=A0A4V6RHD3_9PEZI|nr:hypothetical protein EX30DRAFT_342315 [Ascodesmis nigricans]
MIPRTVLRGLLARRSPTLIRTARRNASSSSGPSGSSQSSDLPWIIGSAGVTVSAAYYLLSSSPVEKKGHHATGHGAHGVHEETKAAATSVKEQASAAAAAAKEKATAAKEKAAAAVETAKEKATELTPAKSTSEKAIDTAKEKTSEAAETAQAAATEKASGAVESVKEKASEVVEAAKEKVSEAATTTKGGETSQKKAYDAEAATENPASKDPGYIAGAKDVGGAGTISGKQRGLSNDDTQHALLHTERGQAIKMKGEGTMHETAKSKGTVDVNRPIK